MAGEERGLVSETDPTPVWVLDGGDLIEGSQLHASASCCEGHYRFDRKQAFLDNR